MYNLSINTTTPGELREAIKGLAELFSNDCKSCSSTSEQKTKTPAPALAVAASAPVVGSPAVATSSPTIASPSADPGSVTIAQVRETVQAITTGNVANRDKVKAILAEYGAESVKTLDPQHFADFLTKVKAIA